jgi:hypothetical protein
MTRDFDLFLDTFSGVQQYCLYGSERTTTTVIGLLRACMSGGQSWVTLPQNRMRLTLEWDIEFDSATESSREMVSDS